MYVHKQEKKRAPRPPSRNVAGFMRVKPATLSKTRPLKSAVVEVSAPSPSPYSRGGSSSSKAKRAVTVAIAASRIQKKPTQVVKERSSSAQSDKVQVPLERYLRPLSRGGRISSQLSELSTEESRIHVVEETSEKYSFRPDWLQNKLEGKPYIPKYSPKDYNELYRSPRKGRALDDDISFADEPNEIELEDETLVTGMVLPDELDSSSASENESAEKLPKNEPLSPTLLRRSPSLPSMNSLRNLKPDTMSKGAIVEVLSKSGDIERPPRSQLESHESQMLTELRKDESYERDGVERYDATSRTPSEGPPSVLPSRSPSPQPSSNGGIDTLASASNAGIGRESSPSHSHRRGDLGFLGVTKFKSPGSPPRNWGLGLLKSEQNPENPGNVSDESADDDGVRRIQLGDVPLLHMPKSWKRPVVPEGPNWRDAPNVVHLDPTVDLGMEEKARAILKSKQRQREEETRKLNAEEKNTDGHVVITVRGSEAKLGEPDNGEDQLTPYERAKRFATAFFVSSGVGAHLDSTSNAFEKYDLRPRRRTPKKSPQSKLLSSVESVQSSSSFVQKPTRKLSQAQMRMEANYLGDHDKLVGGVNVDDPQAQGLTPPAGSSPRSLASTSKKGDSRDLSPTDRLKASAIEAASERESIANPNMYQETILTSERLKDRKARVSAISERSEEDENRTSWLDSSPRSQTRMRRRSSIGTSVLTVSTNGDSPRSSSFKQEQDVTETLIGLPPRVLSRRDSLSSIISDFTEKHMGLDKARMDQIDDEIREKLHKADGNTPFRRRIRTDGVADRLMRQVTTPHISVSSFDDSDNKAILLEGISRKTLAVESSDQMKMRSNMLKQGNVDTLSDAKNYVDRMGTHGTIAPPPPEVKHSQYFIEVEERKSKRMQRILAFYVRMGNSLCHKEKPRIAIKKYFKKAKKIATDLGDRNMEAICLTLLGTAYHLAGDHQMGAQYQSLAMEFSEKLDDPGLKTAQLLSMASSLTQYDLTKTSMEMFREAEDIFTEMGITSTSLNDMGAEVDSSSEDEVPPRPVVGAEGMPANSVDEGGKEVAGVVEEKDMLFRSALKLDIHKDMMAAHVQGDEHGQFNACMHIAVLCMDMAQNSEAMVYLQQAFAVALALERMDLQAESLGMRGDMHFHSGQYKDAVVAYESSKALWAGHVALDDTDICDCAIKYATLVGNLGATYYRDGNHENALFNLKLARKIRRMTKNKDDIGSCSELGYMGLVRFQQGEVTVALKDFNSAMKLAKKGGDEYSTCILGNNIAACLLSLGKWHEAWKTLLRAEVVWEVHFFKSMYNKMWARVKDQVLGGQEAANQLSQVALVQQGEFRNALVLAERLRLKGYREYYLSCGLAEDMQDWEVDCHVVDPKLLEINMDDIGLPLSTPGGSSLLNIIIAAARSSEANIFFYSIPEKNASMYIWVVQPSGAIKFTEVNLNYELRVRKLSSVSDLVRTCLNLGLDIRSKVGSYDFEMMNLQRSRGELWKYLRFIYNIFLKPALDLLPPMHKKNIVVVPDGPVMETIPFAACVDQYGNHASQDYSIQFSPTIFMHSLVMGRARKRSKLPNALCVCNPAGMQVPTTADGDYLSDVQMIDLPEVPQAEDIAAHRIFTKVFKGESATREAVMEDIETAEIVHYCTRSYSDLRVITLANQQNLFQVKGERSARWSTAGAVLQEQAITIEDIVHMKIKSRLWVLSPCSQHRQPQEDKKMTSLAAALLKSGVSGAVISRWEVTGGGHVFFFRNFYENYARTNSPVQALQAGTQACIRSHEYNHPHYWAGYVCWGV